MSMTANRFKELLALGAIDFNSDTFKMILMQPGFTFSRSTHMAYANVIAFELDTAFGYTAGGVTLAGVSVTRDNTVNAAIVTWNNAIWTASGGNLEASGAIIYDDTVAAPEVDPIIGHINFNGSIITYDAGVFTVANPTVAIR